ncbi:MAG: prephenate dehydrogenase [Candidatus Omnitrophica bacterium]|nr:prephenate dehydrogenase [Candidatus Omnitrophota bacterium]MDD5354993.1 prephenate dehydrogenase [Candidatus Omnitrophota bacterium]
MFNRITIIGVGLIGGSLAKDIKKKKLCNKLAGFFRNKHKLNKAIREKIVDIGCSDLKESIKNSDLVILALPINHIIRTMFEIKKIADSKTIIMDVGSTKNKIAQVADKLGLNFVGTHPLAGSEKKGIDFSAERLFDNSKVIITPTKKTNKKAIRKVKTLWEKLNANVITLSPQQHDKIISFTSHLPHLVSFSLINSIPQKFLPFGASGLKDTTRIALSDAEIWSDIFLNNKELLKSLDALRKELGEMARLIKTNKRNNLIQNINKARNKRKSIE